MSSANIHKADTNTRDENGQALTLPKNNEEALSTYLHNILDSVPSDTTRGFIVEHLSKGITFTGAGIPEAIIKPDQIPPNLSVYPMDKKYYIWKNSLHYLSFTQGFPAWPTSGNPLWEKSPFESDANYRLLKLYINLKEKHTIRRLDLLIKDIKLLSATEPELNEHLKIFDSRPEELTDLFQCYSWALRTYAYDIYSKTETIKKREAAAEDFLTKSQAQAAAILKHLKFYFEQETTLDGEEGGEGETIPLWLTELSAKDAVAAYKTLHQIQKENLGVANPNLAGSGGPGNSFGQLPLNADLNKLMEAIGTQGDPAKNNTLRIEDDGETRGLRQENSMERIKQILQNPEQAKALQALMLSRKKEETTNVNININTDNKSKDSTVIDVEAEVVEGDK